MRYLHKQILLIAQFLAVALAFFFVYGAIAVFLYAFSEISLAEVIEYLEILAGSEALSFGAVAYEVIRGKMNLENFIAWVCDSLDGTNDNNLADDEESDMKEKVVEREIIKSLKRK